MNKKMIIMTKINIKTRAIRYPSPAVIASAYDNEGKADACTLAFATMCSHQPPCIMIAINHSAKRKTLEDITLQKEFAVGFPSIDQVSQTDYLGIFSGHDEDKLEKLSLTTTKAQNVNAPIINELKLSVECKVINIIKIGSHAQITGEIVNILADEDILDENGKISMRLLNPIVYDDVLYDYYSIADKVADAFNVGLKNK